MVAAFQFLAAIHSYKQRNGNRVSSYFANQATLTFGGASSSLRPMNIIRHTDANFAGRLGQLTAPSSLFDPVIEERTRAIVNDVKTRGDAALLELTARFDGAQLSADQLRVTQSEL